MNREIKQALQLYAPITSLALIAFVVVYQFIKPAWRIIYASPAARPRG